VKIQGPANQPLPLDRPVTPGRPGVPSRAAADAALRSVLTDEERAFFEQLQTLGPLSYGPKRTSGATPDAPRGLRIDVRA
jgi:hypothetical protein